MRAKMGKADDYDGLDLIAMQKENVLYEALIVGNRSYYKRVCEWLHLSSNICECSTVLFKIVNDLQNQIHVAVVKHINIRAARIHCGQTIHPDTALQSVFLGRVLECRIDLVFRCSNYET